MALSVQCNLYILFHAFSSELLEVSHILDSYSSYRLLRMMQHFSDMILFSDGLFGRFDLKLDVFVLIRYDRLLKLFYSIAK